MLPPVTFGGITTLVHAETGMKWNHSDGVKISICFHGQRLNEPLESEKNVLELQIAKAAAGLGG